MVKHLRILGPTFTMNTLGFSPTAKIYQAKLEARRDLNDRTSEFDFVVETSDFSFVPGQYVWLVLPWLENEQSGNRRAFSITSAPNAVPKITVLMRKTQSAFKQALWQMNPGDEVNIIGPHGTSFCLQESTPERVCWLASGVGIAPFLSHIRANYEQWQQKNVLLLYYGNVNESLLFEQELAELDQSRTWLTVVQQQSDFANLGFPQDTIGSFQEYWISGKPKFVNKASEKLHQLSEHPNCVFENYYPSQPNELTEETIQTVLEKMRRSEETQDNPFYLAVQSSNHHTIITDPNGKIVYANPAAERITGFHFSEMINQTPRLWGALHSLTTYTELWKIKESKLPYVGRVTNRRKNGELYTAIAHISPIMSSSNQLLGFVANEEDVSELIRSQEEVSQKNEELKQESELIKKITERLELATDAAKIGVWDWSLETGIIEWSQVMRELFGVSSDRQISREFWEQLITDDDRGRIVAEVNQAVESKTTARFLYKISRPNDEVAHIQNVALIVRGQDGAPIRLLGVAWDVTKETEVDRMKSEFISMASHQLRTPLSTIRWYCELLGDSLQETKSEDQEEYLHTMYSATQRMIELVNGLLNITRIEMGTFSIHPTECSIQDILDSVLTDVRAQREQSAVEVRLVVDEIPTVQLDKNLTHIILLNLLTNAIKYSFKGGEVTVTVKKLESGHEIGGRVLPEPSIVIAVSDKGIGIPLDQQANMFGKMFRAENARVHENDGDGLGMYLVKAIVMEAGGEIWFESAENMGTTFYVRIPESGMKSRQGSRELDPVS